MWKAVLPLLMGWAGSIFAWAAPAPFTPDVFLSRYCLDCHDSKNRKGERRLDDLPKSIGTDFGAAERWQEVMDQLQLGEMPPPKKRQPSEEERRGFIAWLEQELSAARVAARSQAGRVVHRRLNRSEYLYTIRDLFGFIGDFDPTMSFPGDEEVEGFRNIGSVLRTSRFHLEQYLKAADAVIAQAYDLAEVNGKSEVRTWRDSAESRRGLNDAFGLGVVSAEKAQGPAYIHLSHGLRNQELIFDSKLFLSGLGESGVPHSGWYEVEVEATAANRHHPYGNDLMDQGLRPFFKDLKGYYDDSQPMKLGVGRQGAGLRGNGWRLIPPNIVESTELPDDRYTTVRFRVWLDQGTVPYLAWIDGPPKGTRGHFISLKLHKYDPNVPKIDPKVWQNLALRAERDKLYQHLYQGPEIRVQHWQIKGPLREEREVHPARKLLFGGIAPEELRVEPERVRNELRRVASILFRQEASDQDVEPYAQELLSRMDGLTRYAIAARPVFKAMLCSAEFLFLSEPESGGETIPPMQQVTRLSYFLTGGPPDESLRALAASGSLDGDSIRRETDRLLDSPQADRFLSLFTEQWLGLNKLGTMPPAKETFPSYHIDRLETAMREETWRFVAELVRRNQPVTALVDADFTYLNAGLARLYGLPPIPGEKLQRVVLPSGWDRCGLLGHASVLTVTANGVETSPVKRGVWLLEKIFGTPPSPPPPDVPPIEPDIRGATTIRQQLEKHRHIQACADCHARIDPLGFVFEVYDPIGQFRSTYPNKAQIETRGEYRGERFESLGDVRGYLRRHPDLMAHNLVHRLLTYALGRSLGFADQPAVQRIQKEWKEAGLGLRDLVRLVAGSELMRRP
jgi:hypothetical protein